MADHQASFDSNEWLQVASGIALYPLPSNSEFFLPANMSAHSWLDSAAPHDDPLSQFASSFHPHFSEHKPKPRQELHFNVTDVNLHSSPMSIKPQEELQIPFDFAPAQHDVLPAHPPPARRRTPSPRKAKKSIHKNPPQRAPAAVLHARNAAKSKSTPKVKQSAPHDAQKRPTDDDSRKRHNKMMRDNRIRFNNKFKELEELLTALQDRKLENKPMKNKIQILERAMLQYALMDSERAKLKNELMFSPSVAPSIPNHLLDVMASRTSVKDACELVVRYMCSVMNWKYGEVWVNNTSYATDCVVTSSDYELSTAYVSPMNVLSTREKLERFAKSSQSVGLGQMIHKLSSLRNPVWIADVSTEADEFSRSGMAKSCGISTALVMPVFLDVSVGSPPDAIITMMHANDELLPYHDGVRPYHGESISKVTDLVAAVVQTRRS